jgi:hypothetical protein
MTRRVTNSDTTIKMRGMEALAKALGSANAARFLSLFRGDKVDYVKASRRLYQGQGLDEIYARAAKNWRG